MCTHCDDNDCTDKYCDMPPHVDHFVDPRVEDRIHIAQILMKIVLPMKNFVIKGGFVRDGGYKSNGGDWAESTFDIDLDYIGGSITSALANLKQKLGTVDISVINYGLVCEPTYHTMYSFKLYRWNLEYHGTMVDIDICYKPTYHLDFDVNALKLTSDGLTKWYEDLDFINVINNIKKKQFRVMWSSDWKAKQLGIILQRIHKMEKRGWKCLNFAEIGKYFDGTKDFTFFGKDIMYFTMMSKFNVKKDYEEQECKHCKKMVKKGDYVPISSWCGHENLHHHRCVMAEWMSLHSVTSRNSKTNYHPWCQKCDDPKNFMGNDLF